MLYGCNVKHTEHNRTRCVLPDAVGLSRLGQLISSETVCHFKYAVRDASYCVCK